VKRADRVERNRGWIPSLVWIIRRAFPYLKLVAISCYSVSNVNTFICVTPLEDAIEAFWSENPLLIGIVGPAGPPLKFYAVCINTVGHIQAFVSESGDLLWSRSSAEIRNREVGDGFCVAVVDHGCCPVCIICGRKT